MASRDHVLVFRPLDRLVNVCWKMNLGIILVDGSSIVSEGHNIIAFH